MSDRIARLLHKAFCPAVDWEHEKAATQAWYLKAAAAMEAVIRFKDQEPARYEPANTERAPLKT